MGEVTTISVANCHDVMIHTAAVVGSEDSVPEMTIVNVTDLRLKFKNEEAKDPLPELVRPEPRNKQSNRGVAFLAKNVSITCHRNTFNGAGFKSIGKIIIQDIILLTTVA